MSVGIRRLGPDDRQAFRAVRLAALVESPGNFFASLADARARPDRWWHDLLAQETAALFGAFDGETLVGITDVFTDRDDPTGQTAALGMTWLDPAYRGRGVSHLLYAERLAWARGRGFARVEVSHRASNAPSAAAMRRAGFRHIATRRRRWPDGVEDDDLLYELTLA